MIIGALAEALPGAATAASNGANTTAVFSGTDPRTGRGYLYLETLGGGGGGRRDRDGTDGVQVHTTNTSQPAGGGDRDRVPAARRALRAGRRFGRSRKAARRPGAAPGGGAGGA